MENLDLNIDNYELNDILNLFKISINFSKQDLKSCKKMVLMTHPDKSKLESKYFLFFCKAYKRLIFIYDFKNKKTNNIKVTDNEDIDNEDINMRNKIKNFTKDKNFNNKFNEIFLKNKIVNEYEKNGYEDWLSNDTDKILDENELNNLNKNEQLLLIEKIKKQKSAISKINNIKNLSDYNHFNTIVNDKPEYYEAPLFASLNFDDVKKVHSEGIIPVCDDDRPQETFNSVNSLLHFRNNQNIKPLTDIESKHILENENSKNEEKYNKMLYKLAKQTEENKKISKNIKSSFLFLNH